MISTEDEEAIKHILVAGELIQQWSKGGKERFLDDPMRQSAVERQFEVIGEATKRVSDATRQRHPQVPWRSMAGFRDFIVHSYDSVVAEKVWDAIGGPLREALAELRRVVE